MPGDPEVDGPVLAWCRARRVPLRSAAPDSWSAAADPQVRRAQAPSG